MKHLNFLSNLLSLSLGSPCTDVSLDRRLTVGSPSGRYCSGLMRLVFILAILLTVGVGNVWGTSATWSLVTSEPADWSGEYLVVYSTGCFNGSLTSGFDSSNPVSVSISSNSITLDDQYSVTVSKVSSKYYIQTASGYYIGRNSDSNGVDASTTRTDNYAITFASWNSTNKTIKITGKGGRCLGSNSSNSYKWRFFSSSNAYVNVKLFKKDAGCDGTPLDAPTVTATPSSNSIALSWPNDANATSYTVTCKNTSSGVAAGSVGSVTGTTTKTCTISSLTNGTEYTWSVTAIGNGTNKCNSDPTSANAIPGTYYTVTFMNNGETYATKSIRSGTNLILPDNPSTCDVSKEFVGWSTTNIGSTPTNTKPTMKSTFSTISSATTLYAVFAQKTANSYKLGDANDLIEGQKVLIVNQNASQAMSNTNNSGKLTATGVTISSSTISSPAASLIWTVELDGATKYKFKNTYYVYAYSTSAVYCDDDDSKYPDSWTLTYAGSTGKYYMHSDRGTSSYRLQDYSSNFKLYTSNTTDVFKQSFFIPAYTKYVTQCCTPLGSINGSFF